MNLTPEQILILGLIVPVIVQGVKLMSAWLKRPIDRKVITVFLFIVAIIMAYIFARPALPVWPSPVEDPGIYSGLVIQFIISLIGLASAIVGFAVIIYNLLLQKVFDALDVGKSKVDKLSGLTDYLKELNEE